MRNLDGLYEVLAPDCTLVKESPKTSIITERNNPKVRVRKCDMAKLGSKHERPTELASYEDRQNKQENIRQKIPNHKKDPTSDEPR